MKLRPRHVVVGVGVVLSIAVLFDLGRGASLSLKAASVAPTGPPINYDPAGHAVRLTNERRARWLKLAPLPVGGKAKPLVIEGADQKKLQIPAADGKPTVLAFTSASRESVQIVAPLREFEHYYKGRIHVALVVLNTDPLPWEEYGKEFAKTAVVRVLDKEARLFAELRPGGKDPEKLPAFWGFDGQGRLRYFHQPRDLYDIWTRPLRIALKLPKPDFDSATD